MKTITAHVVCKNEERWIWYSLMSIINHVDKILICDTGSNDKTVEIIKSINNPKIELTEVGEVNPKQFTEIRNKQIKETKTDWIFICDADEIWDNKSLETIISRIHNCENNIIGAFVHYFEFVKDIWHYYMGHEQIIFPLNEKKTYGWYALRFMKNIQGMTCGNDYGAEGFFTPNGNEFHKNGFNNYLWGDDIYYFHSRNLIRSSSQENDAKVMLRTEKAHHHKINKIPEIYKGLKVTYPEVFSIEHPHIVPDIYQLYQKE